MDALLEMPPAVADLPSAAAPARAVDAGARMLLTILYLDPLGRLLHEGSLTGRVVSAATGALGFAPDAAPDRTVRVDMRVVALVHLLAGGPVSELAGDVEVLASWRVVEPSEPPAVLWARHGRRRKDRSQGDRLPA